MITTIYISRHAEPLKVTKLMSKDTFQISNEKLVLTIDGERNAEKLSKYKELQDVDVVIASNYVRAIETAKYVAYQNDKNLLIFDDFGERKYGIESWTELPKDFEKRQLNDVDYKMKNGECVREVSKRMRDAVINVIKENRGKKVFIASHATAIICLLLNWCTVKLIDPSKFIRHIYFEDEMIFDGSFNAPELFKLEFNEQNELISIKNVREWMK